LTVDHPLARWFDGFAECDVSLVIAPFLAHFVREHCVEILTSMIQAEFFLTDHDIDYVFARGNTDIESLGILLAQNHRNNKKNVCVQHAGSCLAGDAMSIYDTNTYDAILTRDPITHSYFLNATPIIKEKKVYCSPHYLFQIKKKYARSKPIKSNKIIYVQKKFFNRIKNYQENDYPFAWYFDFQKAIINFFDRYTRLCDDEFIYKHSIRQIWANESVIPYIRSLNNPRLKIETAHFLKSFGKADRIIVDYPSGAFFEAAVSAKSILCIFPDSFSVNPKAVQLCGNSLQAFKDIPDAIEKIEKYVRSDPDDYRVNMPIALDYHLINKFFVENP